MASAYSLRSATLQPRITKSRRSNARISPNQKKEGDLDVPVDPNAISPTLFKRFQALATRTPTKPKTNTKSTTATKKRVNARKVRTATDVSLPKEPTQLMPVDPQETYSTDMDITPVKHNVTFDAPQTAPPKISSTVEKPFEIWEDPALQNEELPVPTNSMPEPSPTSNKENSAMVEDIIRDPAPAVVFQAEIIPVSSSQDGSATERVESSARELSDEAVARNILKDVTSETAPQYSNVAGEFFKVGYSPTSMFYASRRFSNGGEGLYSKDMPPPSASTRTVGSAHYRVNTINLFKKKPIFASLLDSRSPTTPMRVPTHVHESRLSRKIFPLAATTTSVLAENMKLPSSSKALPENFGQQSLFTEQSIEKSVEETAVPSNRDSISLPEPAEPATIMVQESRQSVDYSPEKDSTIVYQLRPRPTPKPAHFLGSLGNLNREGTTPTAERVSKKKRSDVKK